MRSDIEVTFKAFQADDGTGPYDIRIVIPKSQYLLVAEDNSYYYVAPVHALMQHAVAQSSTDQSKEGTSHE